MSSPARAARRAAERAAAKQARKAAPFTTPAPAAGPTLPPPDSQTSADAPAAHFVPVKWGRTARTLLLSPEEAPLWDSHLTSYFDQYRTVTEEEFNLVGQMAETWWRAEQIPMLIADIYALGAIAFANLFVNEPEALRPSLVGGHTHMTYCQRIEKLYLQESRLQRHHTQLAKQLKELQADREETQSAAPESAQPQSPASPETSHQPHAPQTASAHSPDDKPAEVFTNYGSPLASFVTYPAHTADQLFQTTA